MATQPKPWTAAALEFIGALKAADSPLAIWAEVRIDNGATVAEVRGELATAIGIAWALSTGEGVRA